MKKIIIIFAIAFIIVFSFICGYYLNKDSNNNYKMAEIEKNLKDELIESNNENAVFYESITEASFREEKISPNAVLVIKKYYRKCGHTIEDEAEMPEEAVNKTKQELQSLYSSWIIKEFSSNRVVLYKEIDGICNEHYILRKVDNIVAVFSIDEKGEEKLQERTGISTQYLTKEDNEKLEKGIKAIGRIQLNSILEDYE